MEASPWIVVVALVVVIALIVLMVYAARCNMPLLAVAVLAGILTFAVLVAAVKLWSERAACLVFYVITVLFLVFFACISHAYYLRDCRYKAFDKSD